MADPAGFLARWSRLKQAERAKAAPRNDTLPGGSPPAAAGEPPSELPPLDSLSKDSDFTVFMRPGVPEELRNAALRRLWTSDPVYANLDGLLEYGEDFAAPFQAAGVVATVYRVLEGMPDPEKAPDDPAAAEPPPSDPAHTAQAETPASPIEPDPAEG